MKVVSMTIRAFWKGEFGISGSVEDHGQLYNVTLEIKGSHVNSYSCSCTSLNCRDGRRRSSYKSMCAHEEILLAAYREREKEETEKLVLTSPQVRTMIREYTNREVAEIERADEEEPVDFLPTILLSRHDVKAEFKLGRERQYVIRDLVGFALAMERGAFVEYGKNLAFHHTMDVFSKESRPLASMVLELVNTYREHYEQFQKNGFAAAPTLRELNLSKADRDRFFGLLAGRVVEVENVRGIKERLLVCEGTPDLAVSVRKFGKDGIKVALNQDIGSFTGERYLYIISQGRLCRCDENCSPILKVFFEQMTQGAGAPYEVTVSPKDIPLFYERVLRKLEPYGILDIKDVDLESFRPVALKAAFAFDSGGPGEIIMCPTLSYGDYSFHPVEDENLPRNVCRDIPGEFRISRVITKYFKYRAPETDDLIIRNDDDAMYRLLTKGIEEMQGLGDVLLSESAAKLRVLPAPAVSVGVNTTGDWLELTVDTGELNGADLQRILAEYRLKKPYYRLKSGEFLKLDDGGLMAVARMMDGLAISRGDLPGKKWRVPKYRAFYMDSLYKEYGGVKFYRDNLFKKMVREMKSVEDSDFTIPPSLQPVLRGYQKYGFRWLKTLDAYGFGGILADDMGLGKTVQVISLLLDEKEKTEKTEKTPLSIIVCPASLVYNWECELQMFAPSLRVKAIVGTGVEREELLSRLETYDVAVTSYDLLKRDILLYETMQFRFQIIDEAQYIKNPGTQSAKAVKHIRAKTKYALTGTPIENRLSELWSIFDYLMPGFLYSYQKFKKLYELPIVKDGAEEELKNLRQMTGPFILRRLKKDVLKDLPEKLETVVYSKPEEVQKELYTANACLLKQKLTGQSGREYGSEKIGILAELTKLRQICCDPGLCYENYKGGAAKLETCMELVENGIEGGHKILLFSQFTSMLQVIKKRLEKEGICYHVLTGATPKEERLRMVNAFHKDDIPVFLISLKAGGTGLNLTAADMVIHYDPWWNVAAQNQATDRTHRIGQEKQVSVFKLIMKDTIEENILKLQESKKELADQIITEGTVSLSGLSREELLEILS